MAGLSSDQIDAVHLSTELPLKTKEVAQATHHTGSKCLPPGETSCRTSDRQ